MTQATRNRIAQAAKRQHATDMRLSFEDDPMSPVVSCLLVPQKYAPQKEVKEEDTATKRYLNHVCGAETRN